MSCRRAVALLCLVAVLGVSRSEANLVLNGDFGIWTDDSTPGNWSAEARTNAGIFHETGSFRSGPASLRIERRQSGTGSNKGVIQGVPVTAGTDYTISSWIATPVMPDTTQYASARVIITWRNSSNAAVGSTNPGYIHAADWTEQTYGAQAPNNPNGDSVAVTADVIVRCYGRSGGIAGGIVYVDDVSFDVGAVEEGKPAPVLKDGFEISPNPFNGATLLSYSLPGSGLARLAIYDATGQIVREFTSSGNGMHEFQWDGTNEAGDKLPGGVYFAALEQNHEPRAVQKVMLMR
jgi:hypothetical protein